MLLGVVVRVKLRLLFVDYHVLWNGHRAHSRCCASIPTSISRTFHLPKLRLCPHEALTPHPPALALAPTIYSLSVNRTPLGTSFMSGFVQDVSFCVWLLSLHTASSGSIHMVAGGRMPSFLRLNKNIPACGWTHCVCL